MADRIVCMSEGRIEQIGASADLYERPASLFVASFIGSPPINLLEGHAEAGAIRLGERTVAISPGIEGPVAVGIRPEQLTLGNGPIRGRVIDNEPHGRETLYLVETEIGALRVVEPGATPRFRTGDAVDLRWEHSLPFEAGSGRRLEGAVRADIA